MNPLGWASEFAVTTGGLKFDAANLAISSGAEIDEGLSVDGFVKKMDRSISAFKDGCYSAATNPFHDYSNVVK